MPPVACRQPRWQPRGGVRRSRPAVSATRSYYSSWNSGRRFHRSTQRAEPSLTSQPGGERRRKPRPPSGDQGTPRRRVVPLASGSQRLAILLVNGRTKRFRGAAEGGEKSAPPSSWGRCRGRARTTTRTNREIGRAHGSRSSRPRTPRRRARPWETPCRDTRGTSCGLRQARPSQLHRLSERRRTESSHTRPIALSRRSRRSPPRAATIRPHRRPGRGLPTFHAALRGDLR